MIIQPGVKLDSMVAELFFSKHNEVKVWKDSIKRLKKEQEKIRKAQAELSNSRIFITSGTNHSWYYNTSAAGSITPFPIYNSLNETVQAAPTLRYSSGSYEFDFFPRYSTKIEDALYVYKTLKIFPYVKKLSIEYDSRHQCWKSVVVFENRDDNGKRERLVRTGNTPEHAIARMAVKIGRLWKA